MRGVGTIEELLQRMVGFDTVNPSVSGRPDAEVALAEYLAGLAGGLGFDVLRLPVDAQRFNLLISYSVSAEAPWLLFDSHLDTVSTEHMTIDPFAGVIREGRMYGRGACDTKSSGAAMLWALDRYRQTGERANNIAILYSVDEEIGKAGASAFATRHLQQLGWMPAGLICGEPTELRPVVAHNGAVRWTLRTQGEPAHSADPSRGKSAISMMVRVIDALESRYVPGLTARHPLTGKAQCSINVIRGGSQVNVIPEHCEIKIDRRIVPGEDGGGVLPAVDRLLAELQESQPDLVYFHEDVFIDPALDPSGNERFIGLVQSVLAGMGLPTEAVGVAYGTDASMLSQVGIPAVVLGPGNIAHAHTRDEWIALDQLHRAVDVYLGLMCRTC